MDRQINIDLESLKREIGELYLQIIFLKQENERLKGGIDKNNKPKLVETGNKRD